MDRLTGDFNGASMFATVEQARQYNKLRRYEDTGLTPEEIEATCAALKLAQARARDYEAEVERLNRAREDANARASAAELAERAARAEAAEKDLSDCKPCACCKHRYTDDCMLEEYIDPCSQFIEGGKWEWRGPEEDKPC